MASNSDMASANTGNKDGWIKKLLEWISHGAEKERKSGGLCST